jgi:PAS domain S-box-containing protein
MRSAVHEQSRQAEGMSALTIATIYVLAGGLWILFSDMLLHALVSDEALLQQLQTSKGWFYVATTGVMLYLLIGRSAGAMRKANREVRRNEEFLRTAINTIPALVFVTDTEDRLLRFNELFARVTGRPSDELVGKPCTELFLFADPETHRQNDREIVRTGRPRLNVIERIETAGGSRWFEISKMPLTDEGGEVEALLGFAVEITDRKLAEDALRESQSLLQSILDNAPVSIFVKDLEGRYQLVNRNFQQRCNLSGEEMLGRTDYDLVPPEQADIYRRHDREVVELNSSIEREDVVSMGGTAHTYIAVKFPLADSGGVPYAVCGISTDITERKLAEERHVAERELSDRIIDSLPGTFYIFDEQGKFLRWNHNLETLTGYTGEEISGMNPLDFLAGADREVLAGKVAETLKVGEATMEADLVSKDGSSAPHFFSGTRITIDGRPCVAGMGFDISKRKRAEALTADRERRLNLIYQNVADSLYVIEVEPGERFRFVSVNGAFLAVTGFRDDQVSGHYVEEVLPPTSHELVKDKYREAIRENRTVRWEEVAEMPAGRRVGEVFVTPVRDEVTGRLYLLGGVHDITDRIAGEEALRESESKFRMLAESSASAILYHLDDGTLAYVNPAAERMTGYTRDELLHLTIWDLLHPSFRPAVEERLRARRGGENIVSQNEVPMIVRGGETRWITYTAGRVVIGGTPAVIAMATDVTERKLAEEQLRASREQLRALSARLLSAREEERKRIAREIHDELGQALTGLIIELSWLEDKLSALPDRGHARPLLDKTASMLRLADSTVESVRRIAAELRPGLLDDFGLVAAIEWHAQEFEQRTGVSCQVTSDLDETILAPEQSTALFRIAQEALTNVARHASATTVQVRITREGGELVLSVEDDGSGISEEKRSSTRSLGVIGMRERAALLGGGVQITAARGGGTRVVARVPVVAGGGEAEAA